MKRSTNRILTTHVGSLIRTPEIIEGLKARASKKPYDQEALAMAMRKGLNELVRKQAEVGVDVPSDGEYGKASWSGYITERMSGLESRPLQLGETPPPLSQEQVQFKEFYQQYNAVNRTMWLPPSISREGMPPSANAERFTITAPIKYQGHAAVQSDIANFKAALQGVKHEEAFLNAITPNRWTDKDPNHIYPTPEAYLFAQADALHEEYKAIVDAGFLVQLDLGLPARRDYSAEGRKASEMEVEAFNHALKGIPEDRVRYHLCWNATNSPHTNDTPLRLIADIMLKIKAQAYVLEAANPRHEHEWRVWKDIKLPEGKILIPGLVTHKTNVVEHPELVAWRIKDFASVVGRENVMVGSDCGFSSNWDTIKVHPSIQWAKLQALSEGAAMASQELWRR